MFRFHWGVGGWAGNTLRSFEEVRGGGGGESGNGRFPRRNGPHGPLLRGNHLLDLGWGPGAFVELHQKDSHAFMTSKGSADTREDE